jgi:RNA polymerase sporulation-specific sigma factor
MIRRYAGFVRLKASSYFIAGGDADDLIQEGLVGLYKAVRDYRVDREASFRSFAELCITRQIITAIKGATRYKHAPLNGYISFSHTPAGHDDQADCTLGDALPGPAVEDPARRVIASQELAALVESLSTNLSGLESRVLALFLEGRPYEEIAASCDCDPKAVDNALQRVKRKIGVHLRERAVPDTC